jgi:DNA-binding IclR family transcriptional regulator
MDRAVSRSFDILECLARARQPSRLSDIAAETGLQKSTVHRILGTLCALGHARQDETGRYGPTLRAWELGAGVVASMPIYRVAAGFLQALHRTTAETVSLTILSGDDVVYLEKIVAARPVRFYTRVGSRAPAPLTASGKAMLAFRPDARSVVERVAAVSNLDVPALMTELSQVRQRGYALSGYSPGVTSIGAAVAAGGAPPDAALSISAPTERLTARKRDTLIDALLETRARMTEALDQR